MPLPVILSDTRRKRVESKDLKTAGRGNGKCVMVNVRRKKEKGKRKKEKGKRKKEGSQAALDAGICVGWGQDKWQKVKNGGSSGMVLF